MSTKRKLDEFNEKGNKNIGHRNMRKRKINQLRDNDTEVDIGEVCHLFF